MCVTKGPSTVTLYTVGDTQAGDTKAGDTQAGDTLTAGLERLHNLLRRSDADMPRQYLMRAVDATSHAFMLPLHHIRLTSLARHGPGAP